MDIGAGKDLQVLKNINTVLFDCDGVLWDANGKAITGAVETLSLLRQMGKRVFFVTNNSSKTRQQYAERCKALGFQATEDEIVCTAWLLAAYFKELLNFQGKVYVIGGAAVASEFTAKAIDFIGPGEETYGATEMGYSTYLSMELDPDVNAVAVAFDPYINYVKVVKAVSYLHKTGCVFVASNMDSCFPTLGEIKLPGTGSIVNFVSTGAGREPVVVGKPNILAKNILEAAHGKFDDERTMMVGDRLNTDIAFGNHCGFKTMAVLTGVATLDDISAAKGSAEEPTYYTSSLMNLMELW
ncbi:glycerol-3-phosphate phosphatase-like [Watersipora subatra]|uniref:glycerol-3-phosphate phosphatase-like n=1 Tax=Watersipora subatra TaxID=2589382 RepID=UPI00355B2969